MGSPNDGDLTTSVTANQSYLLGNPFSSALNGRKFITDNLSSIDGALYFWDHQDEIDHTTATSGHNYGGYIGGYATLNLAMAIPVTYDHSGAVSAKTPQQYIPVGQGFFIAGNASGGAIVFNNSQREFQTIGATTSVFLKSSQKEKTTPTKSSFSSLPIIKLGMNFLDNNDGKYYHRQIGVSFNDKQSFDFDKGYDAEMFDTGKTDFYWKFPNQDKNYIITGVQAYNFDLEVPLEIIMGYTGDISITIDEIKNVKMNVKLTDKLTGISYEILNNKATLTLDAGIYTDRFVLDFKPSIVTLDVEDDIDNLNTNIYVDNKNHNLVISKNNEINIKNVELYNILGKRIGNWTIEVQKEAYQLEIKTQLTTGVYIVKLNTDKGETNKKIIIEK